MSVIAIFRSRASRSPSTVLASTNWETHLEFREHHFPAGRLAAGQKRRPFVPADDWTEGRVRILEEPIHRAAASACAGSRPFRPAARFGRKCRWGMHRSSEVSPVPPGKRLDRKSTKLHASAPPTKMRSPSPQRRRRLREPAVSSWAGTPLRRSSPYGFPATHAFWRHPTRGVSGESHRQVETPGPVTSTETVRRPPAKSLGAIRNTGDGAVVGGSPYAAGFGLPLPPRKAQPFPPAPLRIVTVTSKLEILLGNAATPGSIVALMAGKRRDGRSDAIRRQP